MLGLTLILLPAGCTDKPTALEDAEREFHSWKLRAEQHQSRFSTALRNAADAEAYRAACELTDDQYLQSAKITGPSLPVFSADEGDTVVGLCTLRYEKHRSELGRFYFELDDWDIMRHRSSVPALYSFGLYTKDGREWHSATEPLPPFPNRGPGRAFHLPKGTRSYTSAIVELSEPDFRALATTGLDARGYAFGYKYAIRVPGHAFQALLDVRATIGWLSK